MDPAQRDARSAKAVGVAFLAVAALTLGLLAALARPTSLTQGAVEMLLVAAIWGFGAALVRRAAPA